MVGSAEVADHRGLPARWRLVNNAIVHDNRVQFTGKDLGQLIKRFGP